VDAGFLPSTVSRELLFEFWVSWVMQSCQAEKWYEWLQKATEKDDPVWKLRKNEAIFHKFLDDWLDKPK